MKNPPPRICPGFTLLELLVALSLFSVALLLVYSGLFSAARSWESGERQISSNEVQRLQLGFLQRLLRETIPLTLYDGRENRILFHGDEQYLRFIAPLPSHRGGDWAYLITLQTGPGTTGEDLLLYYERIQENLAIEGEPVEDADDVILVENIEDLAFSYYGDPNESGHPDWQAQWSQPDRLPTLVRVEISLKDNETHPLPVIARLRGSPVRGQLQQVLYNSNSETGRNTGQDAIPQNQE